MKDYYNDGYPRQCPRCGADIHVPDPPHLCKDIQQRLDKQQKILDLIADAIRSYSAMNEETIEDLSIKILEAIRGKWEQE